ncbi:hypothetical protein CRE_17709 [Caenorhabditis remanei]|uniref:Uncharacterized protein n=1 Tax=Caenorhabditis remanei TaxID=31234 RepID=E3NU06_CAERE|nr:hypothetical protein CRE_17709 [Caenorhabditis remanei]
MGKEKLAFAKELTETLRMFREQMVASAEIQQQQMAENRRLHEEIAARAAAGSETETLENMEKTYRQESKSGYYWMRSMNQRSIVM